MERYATVLSLGKSIPHANMLQMLQPWAIYVTLLEKNLIVFCFPEKCPNLEQILVDVTSGVSIL